MKFKSMLLGTAAGLMAVSAANAADLPGEVVPAAVDYVKVCDAFGAGFFYIPGTDTCLDISGRVRFRVEYTEDGDGPGDDNFVMEADGRVDFDARTATEYGTLRSFFRIGNEDADGTAEIDAAFISLGYLTVGYTGDLFYGDVLYGDNTFAYFIGDQDRVGVQLFADDLGGGFYVGGSVEATADGVISTSVDEDGELYLTLRAGIAGQPWGGVDVSFAYGPEAGPVTGGDLWAVKATADLSLIENLDARLVAAYSDEDGADEVITLAGALYYTAGAAGIYTGIAYDIEDGDDSWGANLGLDYTITPGLVGTVEVSYEDTGVDEDFMGLLQLSRTW